MTDLRLGTWQETLDDGPSPVPDGSVRLILTSPPYDNARTYEGTNDLVDFAALARFALRVLCPGGVLAMVLDGAVNDGVQSVTPYRVICEWAALEGWRLLQVLAYGRQGAPGEYKGRFRRDHEPLILMVKDGAEHVCNKDAVAESASPIQAGSMTERDGSKRTGGFSERETFRPIRHRGSLWWYGANGNGHDPSASSGHPATFAERFARDAVDVWSNPGDLVCDPFAGSATVGRACEDLGRRFVGAERVGPCPRCGGGFPERCACRSKDCPAGWLNYHAIGMARLAQRGLFGTGAP